MAATPVTAQADEGSDAAVSQSKSSPQSALAKRTDKRNLVEYAGSPPQWIKAPHLAKAKGKRLAITAKVYAVPVPAKRASRPDRLHFRVTVAKRSASTPKKPASLNLLPDSAVLMRTEKTVKVNQRGVLTLKQKLSKKASRQLMKATHLQRRARVAVSVSHWKDTKRGGVWDLKQITTGDLAKRKDPAPLQRKRTKTAKLQHKVNSGKKQIRQAAGAQLARWQGDSPTHNYIYMDNNTPFTQQLNWNPNIQCMWTGGAANDPSDAVSEEVFSGSTVMFTYFGTSNQSDWPGLNGATADLNAPGTALSWSSDLVESATAAGQSLFDSLGELDTYSEAGAALAVGKAAVTFLGKLIANMPTSTCNSVATYPELFGLSTTVTWAPEEAGQLQGGSAASWNQNYAGTPIGNAGYDGDFDVSFNQDYLQQMLGAQTNFVYYWNGGQPAPMVSNNAPSGTFTGGAATVQDRLMQVVAPNPGNPGSWVAGGMGGSGCDKSSSWSQCMYSRSGTSRDGLSISLVYLTNPTFKAGLQSVGQPPSMTVSEDAQGNYNLSCDLSGMKATLYLPFGKAGSTAIGSASMASQPTNSSGTLPQNANWMVNFYGVSANGQYVYAYSQPSNGMTGYALSANAQQQVVSIAAAAGSGGQTKATGVVSPTDMQNMKTVGGQSAQPVRFGCNATPMISLNGLQISAPDGSSVANAFGNAWPMPTVGGAGWPANYWGANYSYQTDWSWMTNVTELNMTYMGFPISSDSRAYDGTPPNPPLNASAVPGDTEATISWNPPTTTGSAPVTGYTVTASPGGQTCSALAPATSCSVANLTNGTAYTFTVVAYSQAGASAPSLPTSAVKPGNTPGAPTNVTAAAGTLSATVNWTAPASSGSTPIVGYTVTASPGGRTCSALAPATKCTVAGLTAGTSYTFTVTASNTYGSGQVSAPSTAVIPTAPPGG
jgi:hypothetical protein